MFAHQNLITTNSRINELYRGFPEIPTVCFELSTIALGLFGHIFPNIITMQDLRRHKTTNSTNDYHFLSMSEAVDIAKSLGNQTYIAIDPSYFRDSIIDLHGSYRSNSYTMPGRMSDEKEHVALGILYCSIKYFFIENKQIDNPFYIPFDSKNSQLKLDYDHVYNNYIKLLKIKFDGNLDKQNEEKLLQEFVKKYLALYKNHVKNNPFNLTIDQLKKQYPEFMSNLAKQYVEPTTAPTFFPEHQTLEKTIEKITNHVFSLHAYVLSKPQHDCVTVYEDDYAKPCYDN